MIQAPDKRFTAKSALGVMAVILVANALFICSLAVPSPHGKLCQRINSAIATGALRPSVNRDLTDTTRGAENFVDCLVLQAAVYEDGWRNAISSSYVPKNDWASAKTPSSADDTSVKLQRRAPESMTICQVLQDLCSDAPTATGEYRPYYRYWLGTRVTSEVALSLFEIPTVRWIYKALHYLAFLLPLVLAARSSTRLLIALAPVSIYGMLFSAIPLFGQQLSYAPPFIFAIVGPTLVASISARSGSRSSLLYLAAASGCIAAYLDLFNALLLHASLLFWLVYEFEAHRRHSTRSSALLRAALALAIWVLAVTSTVAIKQVIAAAVFGSQEVFGVFFGQLLFRLGASPNQAQFGVALSGWVTFEKLFENLPIITLGSRSLSHLLVALAAITWLVATGFAVGSLFYRTRSAWAWDWVAALAASGILAAWYLALPNHTQIHAYVMGRPLFFPLALGWSLCGCIAYDIMREKSFNSVSLDDARGSSPTASHGSSQGFSNEIL